MALTQEQIKMLEGMDGIDQGLVSGYKSRNATPTLNAPTQTAADVVTTSEANPDLTGPQKAADTGGVDQQSEFTNFTVAMNTAVDMARQQRQDMVLDTMGGLAPAGSLPASSFASVIDQFNRSAAPIQSELIGAALEDRQNDKERKLTVENQIRELSMSVASETGDTKVAQMILAELNKPNPDLDAAINMSLIPLGSEYTRSNNSIVKTTADGTEQVVFATDGGAMYNDDLSAMKPSEAKKFLQDNMTPAFYTRLRKEIGSDARMIQFYEFWMAMNNDERMTVRPEVAYKAWQNEMTQAADSLGLNSDKAEEGKPPDSIYTVSGLNER